MCHSLSHIFIYFHIFSYIFRVAEAGAGARDLEQKRELETLSTSSKNTSNFLVWFCISTISLPHPSLLSEISYPERKELMRSEKAWRVHSTFSPAAPKWCFLLQLRAGTLLHC